MDEIIKFHNDLISEYGEAAFRIGAISAMYEDSGYNVTDETKTIIGMITDVLEGLDEVADELSLADELLMTLEGYLQSDRRTSRYINEYVDLIRVGIQHTDKIYNVYYEFKNLRKLLQNSLEVTKELMDFHGDALVDELIAT